jgi:hypothetical protein
VVGEWDSLLGKPGLEFGQHQKRPGGSADAAAGGHNHDHRLLSAGRPLQAVDLGGDGGEGHIGQRQESVGPGGWGWCARAEILAGQDAVFPLQPVPQAIDLQVGLTAGPSDGFVERLLALHVLGHRPFEVEQRLRPTVGGRHRVVEPAELHLVLRQPAQHDHDQDGGGKIRQGVVDGVGDEAVQAQEHEHQERPQDQR